MRLSDIITGYHWAVFFFKSKLTSMPEIYIFLTNVLLFSIIGVKC